MSGLQGTPTVLAVVVAFREAFSRPSWPYFLSIVVPWLVHQGQRSVRRLIVGGGLRREECGFYRFFSGVRFRREVFFRILFEENRRGVQSRQERLPVDDTLCPKWGRHIFGAASFFDHSPRPRPGFIWGHNWVVLAIVVELLGVYIALPFWVTPYRPQKICKEGESRTRLEIVAEALSCVKRWTSSLILPLADGAYNNKSILTPLIGLGIPLVGRLRSDAVLRRDLPARRGRRRPPRFAPRLPKLGALPRSHNGRRTLRASIYAETVALKVESFDAWWPKSGVEIRVVIARDPEVRRRIFHMSSTDLRTSAAEIVQAFPTRRSIEETFADAELEIGLDTAEVGQRGAPSVTRPSPSSP